MERTMLIVDDHAGFRSQARALFTGGGYDVVGEADESATRQRHRAVDGALRRPRLRAELVWRAHLQELNGLIDRLKRLNLECLPRSFLDEAMHVMSRRALVFASIRVPTQALIDPRQAILRWRGLMESIIRRFDAVHS